MNRALWALLLALAPLQQRDVPAQLPSRGTAAISGQIVSDDASARPVRRAIVTVTGDLPRSRSGITDDEGRFAFERLPVGRFSVSATKPAYVSAAYGAARPGRPGTPISLRADERATIVMRMARGAVLTGAIRDGSGAPLPGVEVQAVSTRGVRAYSLEVPMTDDRGIYRIYGLLPGSYVISARRSLVGGSGEIGRRSAADVDRVLGALTQRGAAAVTANVSASPVEPAQAAAFAPVFYPGTLLAADAVTITVASGEEREGLDFAFTPSAVGRIEGMVTGTNQNGAAIQLTAAPIGTRAGIPVGVANPTLTTRPTMNSGVFAFAGVTPGRYRLMAKTLRPAAAPQGRGSVQTGASRSVFDVTPDPDVLYAMTEVETHGEDITGVSLTLQPGATLAGRITFDASTHQPPADLSSVRVSLAPPGVTGVVTINGALTGNTFGPAAAGAIGADGVFRISGIAPGTYELRHQLPPNLAATWTLRSATAGGRDLLDSTIEIAPGVDLPAASIVFSARRTELSGALRAASGQPASAYFIVAFPADPGLRLASRRVQSVRPGTDGVFTITDLPAGEYLIAALTDVEPADLADPAFLSQIVPAAIPVTLREGEKKTQDLTMAER